MNSRPKTDSRHDSRHDRGHNRGHDKRHDSGHDRGHLSQLGLDRLLADEVQETAQLRVHLDGCARCQERYARRKSQQRAHLRDTLVNVRVDALLAAIQSASDNGARAGRRCVRSTRSAGDDAQRRWRIWVRRWGPLAAVAALVLHVLWPLTDKLNAGDSVRLRSHILKDPPLLRAVVVDAQGQPLRLALERPFAAEAMLGFHAACAEHCLLLLAAVGERGPVTVIEPDKAAPWRLEPGQWNHIPVRLGLQPARGPQRLLGLFCQQVPENGIALLERQYPIDAAGKRDLTLVPQTPSPLCVLRSVLVPGR